MLPRLARPFALLLVVALLVVALLLAACVAPVAPAAEAPADAAADAAAADAAAGATEITYFTFSAAPDHLDALDAMIAAFNVQHPEITVKVETAPFADYFTKLQTLVAGGTAPDVIELNYENFVSYAAKGVLADLSELAAADSAFTSRFYPRAYEAFSLDGVQYGLPQSFSNVVLFYNKDLFDAAGVAYPTDDWTMDDLRAAALELTADNDGDGVNDQWGLSVDLWDMELFWGGAIWGHGGEVISDDRTQTLIGEAAARDAWQLITEMTTIDGSIPDPDTAAQFGDAFAAGVSAMTTIGHWVVPEYAQLEFAWDVAAFPAGPVRRATSVNSAGFVIAAESDAPDAAFEFIKFALSEAGQTRLTELGFALPVLKSVAESPVFLEQQGAAIRQQVFLDATEYAVTKPAFRGYDEWATIIGDGLVPVWTGEADINATLDEIVPMADDVLAANQ